MHGCTPEPPRSSSTQFHPHPHSGRPRLAQADRRVQSTTTRPRVSQSPRPGCEMYSSQTAQTPELSTSPMATRWRASFQKGGKLSDIGLPACPTSRQLFHFYVAHPAHSHLPNRDREGVGALPFFTRPACNLARRGTISRVGSRGPNKEKRMKFRLILLSCALVAAAFAADVT